jgi:uncharacterized membrane protein YsdA (DUF1294 family)
MRQNLGEQTEITSLAGLDPSSFALTSTPAVLVGGCYAGLSLLTWILYGWDKWAAKTGRPRLSERTLHLWTILGGFVGAIAGQILFRHKTRKISFVLSAWGALAAHVAVWAWILSN